MLGNKPSTFEDDLYASALVHLGSASAVAVTDLSDPTSFESTKGQQLHF